jgi:hypothetical protein
MFSDPLFYALRVHDVRVGANWNAVTDPNPNDLQYTTDWLNAARAAHRTPLVSLGIFDTNCNCNYIPSVGQYTRAVKAFVQRFPWVKRFTAWDEPDWVYRPALARHPRLAAAYFNALVRNCHGCTVLAGEFSDQRRGADLRRWVREYTKALRYRPKGWALHNYVDIRGHNTGQLRALLSVTRGPIWLTEISGVVHRGHWPFPYYQPPSAAGRDERFLFSLPRRFHRITRIYHYQWREVPGVGWDSGLLNADGSPRPAYFVVKSAAR